MTERVYPSFNSANWLIDYAAKKVHVDYPKKRTWIEDWDYLLLVYAMGFIGTFVGFGILDILFPNFLPFWVILSLILGIPLLLCIWEVKHQYIRKFKIKHSSSIASTTRYIHKGPLPGKQLVLANAGNYVTRYKLSGDYHRFLKNIEMRCIHKEDRWGDTYYRWLLILRFKTVPRKGEIYLYNARNWDDLAKRGKLKVITGKLPQKVIGT